MKEIFRLSEGMVRDDLDLLDKQTYFPQDISLANVEELFDSINNLQDLMTIPQNKQNVLVFARRFVDVGQYGIYVMLKWLVYSHHIFPFLKINKLLEIYDEILGKVSINHILITRNKFEIYLKKILLKPYIQYLQKLTAIKLSYNRQERKALMDIQNISLSEKHTTSTTQISNKTAISDDQEEMVANWYQMYNLLVFTLQEFAKPIQQLKGYFSQHYPYLNNFYKYICNDIKEIYGRIKQQYLQKSQLVSLMEIQDLEDRINLFIKILQPHQKYESFLTDWSNDRQYKSQKIVQFLQSENKPVKSQNLFLDQILNQHNHIN